MKRNEMLCANKKATRRFPMMNKSQKIYVAGHRGLVGSAIVRCLEKHGYDHLVTRTHSDLDLTDQRDVRAFFDREKPESVFLAAAKVGGILANDTYPGELYSRIQYQ